MHKPALPRDEGVLLQRNQDFPTVKRAGRRATLLRKVSEKPPILSNCSLVEGFFAASPQAPNAALQQRGGCCMCTYLQHDRLTLRDLIWFYAELNDV
jgi:hypothetical protein